MGNNRRNNKRKKENSPSPNITSKTQDKTAQNQQNTAKKVRNNEDKGISATPSQAAQPDIHNSKPINSNFQVVNNLLNSLKFTNHPVCKLRRSDSVQITCFCAEDKKKLINKLKAQQIAFHTFTDPIDKPIYFLLKGYSKFSCEVMLQKLTESGVPASKVQYFINNDIYTTYVVHFDNSINVINATILNQFHKSIGGWTVKWEVMKRSNKRITQCYNCQTWGHSSSNCGLPSRCVKCSGSHEKGACSIPQGGAICCNCGGSHSANHRGCKFYRDHIDKIKKNVKKVHPIAHQDISLQFNSQNEFPNLTNQARPDHVSRILRSQVSFSQILKELSSNNNSIASKLFDAQNKLNSLPNIHETIDIFASMVNDLSSCTDHNGRCLILLKYCTSFSIPNNGS